MTPERGTRGSETVLLVEDETAVWELLRKGLERRGYRVLDAVTAEEALEASRGHAGPIHLLLTDVVMPGMGGLELASRVLALRPGIRVLYMSGYTDEAVARDGFVADDVDFLQKPFSLEELAAKIRAVLDAAPR